MHKQGGVVWVLQVSGAEHNSKTFQTTLDLAKRLTGKVVKQSFVDRGYQGHGVTEAEVWISQKKRHVTPILGRQMRRRSMIGQ
jgi:IS5 family transposase